MKKKKMMMMKKCIHNKINLSILFLSLLPVIWRLYCRLPGSRGRCCGRTARDCQQQLRWQAAPGQKDEVCAGRRCGQWAAGGAEPRVRPRRSPPRSPRSPPPACGEHHRTETQTDRGRHQPISAAASRHLCPPPSTPPPFKPSCPESSQGHFAAHAVQVLPTSHPTTGDRSCQRWPCPLAGHRRATLRPQ